MVMERVRVGLGAVDRPWADVESDQDWTVDGEIELADELAPLEVGERGWRGLRTLSAAHGRGGRGKAWHGAAGLRGIIACKPAFMRGAAPPGCPRTRRCKPH